MREYAALHDVILKGVPAQNVYEELSHIITTSRGISMKRSEEEKMRALQNKIVNLRNSLAQYVEKE